MPLNRKEKPVSENNFFNSNLSKQDMEFELSKTIQNFIISRFQLTKLKPKLQINTLCWGDWVQLKTDF